MNERKWIINLEIGNLISNDGFQYKISKSTASEKPIINCIGHPMLAASELDLVKEIAAEAYSAYIAYLKDLH